jgi:predicted nucleotidyltransferase
MVSLKFEKVNKVTSKDYQITKKLKDRLSNIVSLLDFRVFGSRARGDHEEYSDIDLFLEVNALSKELENKIYDIAWEIGYENLRVFSLHIFTKDEIENSPLRLSPIVKNIFTEGIRI